MKKILFVLIFLVLGFVLSLFYKAYVSRQMDDRPTLIDDKLIPCGEKPNCVSSFNQPDESHYIEPLKIDAMEFSLKQLDLPENFRVVTSTDNYIYATDKSNIFGFVDDLEILYLPEQNLVHFRSASRVGHSDLGANRKRVEAIKILLRQL